MTYFTSSIFTRTQSNKIRTNHLFFLNTVSSCGRGLREWVCPPVRKQSLNTLPSSGQMAQSCSSYSTGMWKVFFMPPRWQQLCFGVVCLFVCLQGISSHLAHMSTWTLADKAHDYCYITKHIFFGHLSTIHLIIMTVLHYKMMWLWQFMSRRSKIIFTVTSQCSVKNVLDNIQSYSWGWTTRLVRWGGNSSFFMCKWQEAQSTEPCVCVSKVVIGDPVWSVGSRCGLHPLHRSGSFVPHTCLEHTLINVTVNAGLHRPNPNVRTSLPLQTQRLHRCISTHFLMLLHSNAP